MNILLNYIYKKKYLPVIILDKSETWKKLKILKIILVGYIFRNYQKKSAINIKNNSVLYKKPTIYSKPIAKLENWKISFDKKM